MKCTNRLSQPKRITPSFILLFLLSLQIALGQNDDVTECPYFNVISEDTTGVSFALISTHIDATISGVIANVIVEQTYFNSGETPLDATYVFPMSTQAAVYGMEMIIDERVIRAEIKQREEARTIFDEANEAGQTASLLEQERPNVFQMSLANIAAGDSLKVRMVYTELLIPREGVYQFVFPNIVGPRYTTNGEPWVSQTSRDSLSVSETELSFDVKINAGMPLQAECTSHEAPFNFLGNSARTQLSTSPGVDFIVDFTLAGNEIETGLLLYECEDENFFLSIIQPPSPEVSFESPPREYIFIMDVSGSMSGEPLAVSKRLISDLLLDLNLEDRFNIIFFAGGSQVLFPNSLPATNENINQALTLIDRRGAGGGTELLPAMQQALDMEGTEDFARTFIILTDGYVTVEKEAFELIRQNLNEANFFSFGIGRSVNRYIIEGIAYVGEGESFVATDFFDANEMADVFKEYIERPALTNIQTTFSGIEVYDVEPLSIPDVFAERPIIVYGKYRKPAEGTLTLTGNHGAGTVSRSFSFSDFSANADENIALKYLWARKRIKLFSDYGISSNDKDSLSVEEQITRLGLRYSLITEYTSFVAVDDSTDSETPIEDTCSGLQFDTIGELVSDAEDLGDRSQLRDRAIIKILESGSHRNGVLRLELEGLDAFNQKDLSLRITNIKGQTILLQDLRPQDIGNTIEWALGPLPAGLYVISLLSPSGVLDTEKFVIRN